MTIARHGRQLSPAGLSVLSWGAGLSIPEYMFTMVLESRRRAASLRQIAFDAPTVRMSTNLSALPQLQGLTSVKLRHTPTPDALSACNAKGADVRAEADNPGKSISSQVAAAYRSTADASGSLLTGLRPVSMTFHPACTLHLTPQCM